MKQKLENSVWALNFFLRFFLAPNVEQQNVDHWSMCDVIKRFLKTLKAEAITNQFNLNDLNKSF